MKYINNEKWTNQILNNNNFYVAIDFDKTLTSKKSADSWATAGEKLGEIFKKRMNDIYNYYAPIEVDYTLDLAKKEKYIQEWYEKCMNLYYEFGLTLDKLLKSVRNSKLEFRNGAKEFIHKLKINQIPVIILSAGIGNVIEQFLKNNNCYFDNMHIISNFIEFDDNGNMKKFNNKNMIHTLNKTMEGHMSTKLRNELLDKKYKMLIGDLVEDIKMVDSKFWDDTCKIGILNKNVEENLKIYNKYFDVVLTDEDATFNIVEKLIF